MFSPETVEAFVRKNPRIMTPSLRAALTRAALRQTTGFDLGHGEEPAPYEAGRNNYYYTLLCSREAELLKELDYIRQEKQKLMAERNDHGTHKSNKSEENLFTV